MPTCDITSRPRVGRNWLPGLLALWLFLALAGCSRTRYLKVREEPYNPLARSLQLLSRKGPQPSSRTWQLLRRYDLAKQQEKSPQVVLAAFQKQVETEPTPDKLYSFAELSYIAGQRLEHDGQVKESLDFYAAAVAHAYLYLFDPSLDRFRNPYDPEFRRACDVYNGSLEAALRIVSLQNKLRPGETQIIQAGKKQFQVQIVSRGPWRAEDLSQLEFVSKYELDTGLTNHHHTYGLGVPLIAVRGKHDDETSAEKYYPPGLSFPVTAFLRVETATPQDVAGNVHRCVLELYDPLNSCDIDVCNRRVPLETDLSTPLAYFLDNPVFRDTDLATIGLRTPGQALGIKGLYMVEPYDPNKIPVLMVHGLWSSPTTWMEMFNDLRAFPELRSRFQFWFYLYPTGQPFWVSAAQMRDVLTEVRQAVDPNQQNPKLDQMVLVGHSMGGLVSQLQTIESGEAFWQTLSDKPFEELKASPEERAKIAKTFYFHPNPAIKRVVTIGTPHQGSSFANSYTRLAGKRLITLPAMMVELSSKLIRDNPGMFRNTELITTTTSIDSLAPDCPIFKPLKSAARAGWTKYHNIVGVVPKEDFLGRLSEEGDGVVGFKSAHLSYVASEIVVPADHLRVHAHPLAILEVRRILLEHLGELQAIAFVDRDLVPAGYCPPPGMMPLETSPGSWPVSPASAAVPVQPPEQISALQLYGPLPRPVGVSRLR